MTSRQAIQVLMLSPIYFKLRPKDRWQLVNHYRRLFFKISSDLASSLPSQEEK